MIQAATKQTFVTLSLASDTSPKSGSLLASVSQEIQYLAILMVGIQILDGIFTAVGISHYGLSIEGNMVLRYVMSHIGYVATLLLAKSLAVCIVAALCLLSARVNWITRAMRFMVAFYLCGAIIPWTVIFVLKSI